MSKVVDNPEANGTAVDDDTEADDPGATTFQPNSGPGREEMANAFLPEGDEWDAKTMLDISDPHRVALVRNYSEIMPETDHWQEPLDDFTTDFVKAQTSVGGTAREQIVETIKAMFGVDDGNENSAVNAFAEALGAGDDDD
jgi:hypothetical protein